MPKAQGGSPFRDAVVLGTIPGNVETKHAQILIELELGSDPITGRILDGPDTRSFIGWMALVRALELRTRRVASSSPLVGVCSSRRSREPWPLCQSALRDSRIPTRNMPDGGM